MNKAELAIARADSANLIWTAAIALFFTLPDWPLEHAEEVAK
jgi:hypothetical protein